jgi:hypothetical protein
MTTPQPILLPKQWSRHIKSGVLHAISLASFALSYARGRATSQHRLRSQLEASSGEDLGQALATHRGEQDLQLPHEVADEVWVAVDRVDCLDQRPLARLVESSHPELERANFKDLCARLDNSHSPRE